MWCESLSVNLGKIDILPYIAQRVGQHLEFRKARHCDRQINLKALLANAKPEMQEGTFVFCTLADSDSALARIPKELASNHKT